MAIALLATQVPLPQVPSAVFWIQDNAVNVSPPSIPHAEECVQGATSADKAGNVPQLWNQNAARIDLAAKYGGGAMGICYGLILSAGTGLLADVTAGHANLSGFLEEYAANNSNVLAAASTNFVWLKTSGVIEVKTGLTPPAVDSVLLGAAITDGSGVTSIDFSGVVYIKNGVAYRQTADPGEPGDTPPASWRGWTHTLAGSYWWDGSRYDRLETLLTGNRTTIPTGRTEYVPADTQVVIYDDFDVIGDLYVYGDVRVIA